MSALSKSRNHPRHQRSLSQDRDMSAQSDFRVITSKHNKHKHKTSKSQEKVNNRLSDKSSQGNNNGPSCLVVKSKSEMRISSTREYCIMDPTQFGMSTSHGYMVPIPGHKYIHNRTRKYHDYMNVVIPSGTGIVKEQMKMVVGDLENVLGELQSVVGDLQVLVKQIDIVTSKIDQEYKSENEPNTSNIAENRGKSTSAVDKLTSKRALQSDALKQTTSQSFDLIRRQMSSDYVFHAPVHRGNKASSKILNESTCNFKNQENSEEILTKDADRKSENHPTAFRKETHFPIRIQMANKLYEQAKKAHEERTKNNNHAITKDCPSVDSCDDNSFRFKNNMFDNNINRCKPAMNKPFDVRQRSRQTSISSNKCNQQYTSGKHLGSNATVIIASPVSNAESDYCGVYERELDLKLELEFDDNLENYNGIDEGNTLELRNYTDYKLLQKLQPPNSLPSWRVYPPAGMASVDLNTIEFSDDLQITTPTESSSDILNDNVVFATRDTSGVNPFSVYDKRRHSEDSVDLHGEFG